MDFHWSTGDLPGAVLLEKTDSSLCKLVVANSSMPRGEILCLLHLGIWSWACTGLTHADTTTLSLYVQLPCCVQKTLFLYGLYHLNLWECTIDIQALSVGDITVPCGALQEFFS